MINSSFESKAQDSNESASGASAALSNIPIRITVDPSRDEGHVSPRLIGANVVYSFEKDAYWANEELASALSEINLHFLRYPGGEVSSVYHWESPTGRGWVDSWDPDFDGKFAHDSAWMNLDDYMQHVRTIGATPVVGVNMESGVKFGRIDEGIDEARRLLLYTRERGYDIEYWFIGNETYLPQSHVQQTAEEYGHYFKLFAEALREIDPNIKLIANWRNTWDDSWAQLLDAAGEHIDVIDLHTYWNWGRATFDSWAGPEPMRQKGETYTETIQHFREQLAKRGREDIEITILEWNIGPAGGERRRPSSYEAGLMNSEMLMQFIKGGLDASTFWPLHWDRSIEYRSLVHRSSLEQGELTTTPTYDVFKMYADVLGEQRLASDNDGEGTFTLVTHNDEKRRLTLFLLQKVDHGGAVELDLGAFDELTDDQQLKIDVLTYQAPDGDRSASTAELATRSWKQSDGGPVRFDVPAYSLTRLQVQLEP